MPASPFAFNGRNPDAIGTERPPSVPINRDYGGRAARSSQRDDPKLPECTTALYAAVP